MGGGKWPGDEAKTIFLLMFFISLFLYFFLSYIVRPKSIICQLEPDEGPATLRTSICAADFRIFFHMKTDNRILRQL